MGDWGKGCCAVFCLISSPGQLGNSASSASHRAMTRRPLRVLDTSAGNFLATILPKSGTEQALGRNPDTAEQWCVSAWAALG